LLPSDRHERIKAQVHQLLERALAGTKAHQKALSPRTTTASSRKLSALIKRLRRPSKRYSIELWDVDGSARVLLTANNEGRAREAFVVMAIQYRDKTVVLWDGVRIIESSITRQNLSRRTKRE
jgi:hypothetical protein